MKATHRVGLALERWRAEGAASFIARALDHRSDRRRERAFRVETLARLDPHRAPPVLNLLGFAPRTSRGGVALQWIDRLAAEARSRTVARLFPLDGRARLEVEEGPRRQAFDLGEAWSTTDTAALQRALATALAATGARLVHVETFAGLPAAGLPDPHQAVASIHDFTAFDVGAGAWLEEARHLFFASPFMHREFVGSRPRLAATSASVVRPALDWPRTGRRRERTGDALHVAFAGALSRHKGADILPSLIAAARRAGASFSVYGAGDDFTPQEFAALGARARGWYRARSLPVLLARDEVDLCVVPSRAPESHCLVIDECRLAGVAVLASDRGALPERLAAGGGVAVAPDDLAATLSNLLHEPAEIREHASSIPSPPAATPADAARGMLAVYAGLAR
jgi:glycosyltransferase involved in cell wall biosynthesis